MDMFGLDEDQSGMSSMRDVFRAMNMVDTKDVTDRVSSNIVNNKKTSSRFVFYSVLDIC